MVWVNRMLSVAVLGMIGCGPGRVGGQTGGVETTGDATDGSTSVGTESSGPTSVGTESAESTETGDPMMTSTTEPTFVPRIEVGSIECDPFMQDCPDGEKCVSYASSGGGWDARKCVPVLGDQPPGEPCTYGGVVDATDDCDETSACYDVADIDGELVGTCFSFCTGTPDFPECPVGSRCLLGGNFSPLLCITTCDPLLQDCNDGLACFWTGGNFNCIFTTQNIPVGNPCGFINDCAAGLVCLAADTLPSCADASCCSAFCDLESGDAPCDAQFPGTACVPVFEQDQAPPGYEQVGVCILPA